MKDYPRIVRVIGDMFAVACGGFCAFGLVSLTPGNFNTGMVYILALLGTVIGLIHGTTENRLARKCAVALTVSMVAVHGYIQFTLWRLNLLSDLWECVLIMAIPAAMLLLVQFVDWFVRKGQNLSTHCPPETWIRWLCRGPCCLAAALKWASFFLTVVYAFTGKLPVNSALTLAFAYQTVTGLLFTAAVWLLTSPTSKSPEKSTQEQTGVTPPARPEEVHPTASEPNTEASPRDKEPTLC